MLNVVSFVQWAGRARRLFAFLCSVPPPKLQQGVVNLKGRIMNIGILKPRPALGACER